MYGYNLLMAASNLPSHASHAFRPISRPPLRILRLDGGQTKIPINRPVKDAVRRHFNLDVSTSGGVFDTGGSHQTTGGRFVWATLATQTFQLFYLAPCPNSAPGGKPTSSPAG